MELAAPVRIGLVTIKPPDLVVRTIRDGCERFEISHPRPDMKRGRLRPDLRIISPNSAENLCVCVHTHYKA